MTTVDRVLRSVVAHVHANLQRHGVESTLTVDRAKKLWQGPAEKLAMLADAWNADPEMLVAAAWSYALATKKPNGPYPNLLGSSIFLRKAISHYLQIPSEAVGHMLTKEFAVQKMLKFHAEQVRLLQREMERGTPLEFITTVPALHRFLMRGDEKVLQSEGAEILKAVADSRLNELLCESFGWPYSRLAARYNELKAACT